MQLLACFTSMPPALDDELEAKAKLRGVVSGQESMSAASKACQQLLARQKETTVRKREWKRCKSDANLFPSAYALPSYTCRNNHACRSAA